MHKLPVAEVRYCFAGGEFGRVVFLLKLGLKTMWDLKKLMDVYGEMSWVTRQEIPKGKGVEKTNTTMTWDGRRRVAEYGVCKVELSREAKSEAEKEPGTPELYIYFMITDKAVAAKAGVVAE